MPSVYLVTGGSGTIGSEVVSELLQKPDVKIFLLLRAKDELDLQNRFSELEPYWSELKEYNRDKITLIKGDTQEINLGISLDNISFLRSSVTHFIHTAGNVRMNLSIDEARTEIFSSTKNVLSISEDFLQSGKLKKIEFVTTIGVVGRYKGVIPEDFFTHQEGFHNTYEQAKYESENLIQAAINKGMPISVFRPSMVIGHSKSGKIRNFQVFYFLCEFLSGKKTKGVLPDFKGHTLDIVPVDFVAKALVASSGDMNSCGKVFHLCSGEHSIPLKDLALSLPDAFFQPSKKIKLKFIPLSFFLFMLKCIYFISDAKTKKAIKTLPWFLTYLKERQIFSNQKTSQYFKQTSLLLPNWQSYIQLIHLYYLDNKRKSSK